MRLRCDPNDGHLQKQCAFSDLEVTALLFAAAIHDVGHPGLTNAFLAKQNYPVAGRYDDVAVLENHSLAIAFQKLQNENFDIFANLNRKQRATLRKIVIDTVLTTDMTKHGRLTAELRAMVERKRTSNGAYSLPKCYTSRIRVLQCVLHCADLSNPTKPLEMYKTWAGSIMNVSLDPVISIGNFQ